MLSTSSRCTKIRAALLGKLVRESYLDSPVLTYRLRGMIVAKEKLTNLLIAVQKRRAMCVSALTNAL